MCKPHPTSVNTSVTWAAKEGQPGAHTLHAAITPALQSLGTRIGAGSRLGLEAWSHPYLAVWLLTVSDSTARAANMKQVQLAKGFRVA